ncbi:hypothetical protein GRF29_154g848702 [Pseudopithomyces chartarum]|uniref:TPR-like protein n=1 Tax=Pseudopithomyces chartarum TaxID=1892770 RepID=A0AAN6RDS1_9PLEO|nr:hypothetical protein GRF29_154g848702 [Pseudopithomyces chartarum]
MDHYSTSLVTEDIIPIVSMDKIYSQDENAASILAISACLGQARIPLTLLDTSYNSTQLKHALEVLRASSLVMLSSSDNSITIPRLVRLCVRAYLRQYGMSTLYAYYALKITAQSFPENSKQFSMLQKGSSYLPHALAILEEYEIASTTSHHLMAMGHSSPLFTTRGHSLYIPDFDNGTFTGSSVPLDYVGPLALRVAHFLCVLGQYSRAMQVATQASRWLSTAPAADVLSCELSITSLFLYLGGPAIFASQIEQILLSQTVLLKSHRPLTIRVLRSKALALQGQGHYSQAEGYHRRAIAICKSTYGSRDIRLLDEEHGLALSLLGQKRPQEALDSLCAIYTTMEEQLTLSNPKTLSVLANIGCALQHLSRWDDAYHATSRALSGRKEVLGADHPHTVQTYANLAQIYVVKGDYSAAESTTRETLRVHVTKLGEDHHLSLHILNNLGYFLLGQERWNEAAETLYRVARKREMVLGFHHCDTLETLFYASEAYWKMRRFDEALELGGKVLRARQILDENSGDRREIEARMAEIQRDRDAIR